MNIGNLAVREKLTGRLYFQRTGTPAWIDLGNVLLTKQEPKLDRVQVVTADKGEVRMTHESVGKAEPRWSVKLDEQAGENLKVLNLAREVMSQEAPGTELGTPGFLIGGVPNLDGQVVHGDGSQSFFLGYANLLSATIIVTSEDVDMGFKEGVDFFVNLVTGRITFTEAMLIATLEEDTIHEVAGISILVGWGRSIAIYEDGGYANGFVAGEWVSLGYAGIFDVEFITAGLVLREGVHYRLNRPEGLVYITEDGEDALQMAAEDVAIHFSAPAVKSYTLLTDAFVRGTAVLVLSDQNEGAPREKITFAAELAVTEWGEHDGQKFNEYTLGLLATSALTVLVRE